MKIDIAPQALGDIESAVTYLRQRNPQAAGAFSDHLFKLIAQLANGEFEGPESMLRGMRGRVRSWPLSPYRIYYRRDDGQFIVLRVYHSARQPIARPVPSTE
jgi:plasmid stabilization system protein ParE